MVSTLRAVAALAAVAVAAIFATQLVLHAAAWRVARTRRVCRADAEGAGAAAALWSVARETTLALLVLLLWPLGASRARANRRHPVVLVHGFASSPASLWLLARRLRGHGWAVSVPRLGAWWHDLGDAADRLAAHLGRVRDEHGATDVVVVAHGLGGLASRLLLRRAGHHAGVRLLVTLGTPHGGTCACAWLRLGPFRRDVRPGSDALRALETAGLPASVEAIAIASPGDALLVPADGAHWADACNVSVEGSGHLHLLVSARVYEIIAENLAVVPDTARRRHGE